MKDMSLRKALYNAGLLDCDYENNHVSTYFDHRPIFLRKDLEEERKRREFLVDEVMALNRKMAALFELLGVEEVREGHHLKKGNRKAEIK